MSRTPTSEQDSTRSEQHSQFELAEFELALGPRQFASLGLVVLTALAVSTGAAYMVGKSVGKVVEVRVPFIPAVQAAEPPRPVVEAPKQVSVPDAPLEGFPESNQSYVQLGSVERGFAILMTQGLRKQGLPALMAPGSSPVVFRVLAGPFKTEEELRQAKELFGGMGLKTFVREFSEPAPAQP